MNRILCRVVPTPYLGFVGLIQSHFVVKGMNPGHPWPSLFLREKVGQRAPAKLVEGMMML